MTEVRIAALASDQVETAAHVLARAFVTNPLHVAAFGSSALAANEGFFRIGLAAMKGTRRVALDDSRIVGVIHWVKSPDCQFSGSEKLRTMPAMIRAFGLRSALKVRSWLTAWSRNDPAEPHIHLGPIGIDPDAQGRRIGRRLMEQYCEELDRARLPGYLETDRPENVEFYRRFGFEVTGTVPVLGLPNYFMRRPA